MPSGIVKLQGDVIAVYVLGRPDRRRRDIANTGKAVGDTLVRAGECWKMTARSSIYGCAGAGRGK